LLGARTLSILKTAVTDLQPETSNNFEIGIDGKGSGWKYDLSAYYNTMNDRIGQVSKGSYYTFENVGDARIRGIDAYLGYSLFANFDINTAITLMDAENRTTGLRLDYTPETILSIAADYRPLTNVLLSTSVFYTGDQTYEKE